MAPTKTAKESATQATTAAGAKTARKIGQSRNNVSKENAKVSGFSVQNKKNVKSGEKQPESKPLTPKQQRFVDEYLTDLNATQAAIRTGYSAKTANVMASQLLTKANIAKAIQNAREKTAAKLEVTRERVLEELAKMAFLDPRRFYKEDGSVKSVPDMDADTAAALVGFEVDEIKIGADGPVVGQTKKVKWSDKRAALDSINRMMGWNQDKLKLQGDEDAPLQQITRVVMIPPKQVAANETKPLTKADE